MHKWRSTDNLSTKSDWNVFWKGTSTQLEEAKERVVKLNASVRFFEEERKGQPR
jgi:hypothetical protein